MHCWSDIETVLLDLDGTIIDLAFDNFLWRHLIPERAAKRLGSPASEVALRIQAAQCDRPPLSYYSVEYWSQILALDVVALHRELRHFVFYRRGSVRLFEHCRARQKRVAIVSNAHPHAIAAKDGVLNFSDEVDAVYSAFDFGLPKQEPEFWDRLQRVEAFDLDSTLFVDDTPAVLQAARNFGIRLAYGIDQPDTTLPPIAASPPAIRFLDELLDQA